MSKLEQEITLSVGFLDKKSIKQLKKEMNLVNGIRVPFIIKTIELEKAEITFGDKIEDMLLSKNIKPNLLSIMEEENGYFMYDTVMKLSDYEEMKINDLKTKVLFDLHKKQ